MVRKSYLLVAILGVMFLFAACESKTSSPESGDNSSHFIDHINTGCANGIEAVAIDYDHAYLQGYYFEEDTLTLDIHFLANCCPGFIEVVEILQNTISIEVMDTLYDCRCICSYDNEFRFLWGHPGEVEISFQSTYWSGSSPVSSFDTLIVLSH